MADIAGIRERLGQEKARLEQAQAELRQAQAQYDQAVASGTITPGTQDALRLRRNLNISSLQAEVETQQTAVQEVSDQLTSAEQTIGDGPRESAGQTVAQSQRANDEQANAVAPPAAAPPATGVTNADRFDSTPNTDVNTDAETRNISDTQSLPPITARPGSIPGRITPPNAPGQSPPAGSVRPALDGSAVVSDDGSVNQPTRQAGAGSASDDATGATNSGVRAALNERFAGKIVPQGNVLDQYASYTYSISIYLMDPTDYQQFITNSQSLPGGSKLLIQSGGAPTGGGIIAGADLDPNLEDPAAAGRARIANLGRNEFFSLDYYLDDVKIQSVSSGKSVGQAHNVTKLQFRVIEPNGITFLDNLYKATDQYVRLSGNPQPNYAAQNYLMAIRFYGYDKDGNLVLSQNQPFLDPISRKRIDTVVEKFIPFRIDAIKFRVANKMAEYDVECSAIRTSIAASRARGTIPYNVELTSQTLKDLLGGQAQFAKAPADGQGRPGATPAVDPKARNPANAGFLNTNESGAGTDFTLGVGA